MSSHHVEIDALYHGPDWTPRPEFLNDVKKLVETPSWTTEWQYDSARATLVAHADLLVWLDLPFVRVTLPQLVKRTLRRRLTSEELWNGNTEPPLRTIFTDREHIIRWGFQTRNKYRTSVPAVERESPHLTVVRLRSRSETVRWLDGPLAASLQL
jgi:hypothetical protein